MTIVILTVFAQVCVITAFVSGYWMGASSVKARRR